MKLNSKFFTILHLSLIALAVIAIISSLGYNMYSNGMPKPHYINKVKISIAGGKERDITLPYNLRNLKPKTPITIRAYIHPKSEDFIFIKTAYTPAVVYTDGVMIYEFGKKSTYPSFMLDPATETFLAKPATHDSSVELKIEFLSPTTRNSMIIYPPITGSFKAIFYELIKQYQSMFLLAVIEIALGISLIVMSLILNFFEKKIRNIFFWFGVFSFTSGIWSFGESTFTSLIFKNPTLLYLLAFFGLFMLAVPLIHLALASINFKNSLPLHILSAFLILASTSAILLQLLGLYPLSSSMYIFHIITPVSLVFLAFFTIYEALRNGNGQAKRFILPVMILTLAALVEVGNYYVHLTYKFSALFQNGIVLFLLVMGITIGFYIRDIAKVKSDNEQLASELEFMKIQMNEQRKYNHLIEETEKALRKQRHDLHHHLIAIKELGNGENEALENYLNSLIANVPQLQNSYCENKAINAIVSHYASICTSHDIPIEIRLVCPEIDNTDFNSELCIVFGNLMENAVEASLKTSRSNKFIRISSNLNYELLIITMDNGCDGELIVENDRFRSSKRDGFGIGLSSIRSVAQKHGGDATFEIRDACFKSSLHMRIDI